MDYEFINRAILDRKFMNMSLIITKVNYGAIDDDDSSGHGYHIIKLSLIPYTLQADLNIDG